MEISERALRRSRRRESDARMDGRVELSLPVQIVHDDGAQDAARAEGSARNVSIGGMFVVTELRLPFGAALMIRIDLPGMSQLAELPAVVRWTSAEGMGVQFGVMGARETHGLLSLMKR
jgi:type IV pilus assembly protein PilZ